MNPGCIKNTSEAEMIIHNMSVLFIFIVTLSVFGRGVAAQGPDEARG